MARIVRASLLAGTLLLSAVPAAHAEPGPTIMWGAFVQEFGSGYVGVGYCVAVAAADTDMIPVFTSVTCSLNSLSRTGSAIGGFAAVEVEDVIPALPVTMCREAFFDYSTSAGIVRVIHPEDCTVIRS